MFIYIVCKWYYRAVFSIKQIKPVWGDVVIFSLLYSTFDKHTLEIYALEMGKEIIFVHDSTIELFLCDREV